MKTGTGQNGATGPDISVLITLDIDNVRITVYGDEKEVYDVIDSEEGTVDAQGDDVYKFKCLDKDGT